MILGHEVVAEGEDGCRYVVNPLTGCGDCRLCRGGTPNLCPRRGLLGLDRPGAFAELITAPSENLLPMPEEMSDELGTLVEPLATPINALGPVEDLSGAVVAVIGAGPIGLLAAYAASRRGAELITCQDIDPARLEHARSFADVVGGSTEAVLPAITDRTDGLGADIVVDAVGVAPTWAAALELVRPGGVVSVVGLAQGDGELAVGEIVRGGITVRGVYAYTPGDFAAALELLRTEPPPLDWVSTVELERGPEVLATLARGEGPVKAVLRP